MTGGPLYRLARRLGLTDGSAGLVRLGLPIALLTWLPLVVLAALGHVLTSGSTIPFLQSIGTHTQLLVAIPLFFAAEGLFDMRAAQTIRLMAADRVIPAHEIPRLDAALRRAIKWRDSWFIEAALAVATLYATWLNVRADLPTELLTWRTTPNGQLTLAGWWYEMVSLPVFRFLLLRWLVRLLVWWDLLWRISGLDLRLIPTHPDRAGGLGGLGVTHVALAPLSFGASAMLVAGFAEHILYGRTDVESFVLPLTGAIVGSTLALIAPLLQFTPRLVSVKQQGLLEYGALAASYVRAFDEKWLRSDPPPKEPLLGSPDLQSLADLANSFQTVRSMGIAPIALFQILLLAAAAALPAAPLVLFVVPLDTLVVEGLKKVLNL